MPMAINFPMLPVCWWWWCRCRAHKTLKTNRRRRQGEGEGGRDYMQCATRWWSSKIRKWTYNTQSIRRAECVCLCVCVEGVAICCCLCVSVRLRQLHPSANNLIVLRKQSIDTHRRRGREGRGVDIRKLAGKLKSAFAAIIHLLL